MKQTTNADNYIFKYAFAGAVLFIVAIIYVTANITNIAMLQLSYTAIAAVLGVGSVALLYKAIKHDKVRLKRI